MRPVPVAPIAVLLALLAACAQSASAGTDASAFTISELKVEGTDLAVVRTLSDNLVSTPDLYFQGKGEVTSTIRTDSPAGGGDFVQSMFFAAQQSGTLSGMATESRAFEWKGVTEVRTNVFGTVVTAVSDPRFNPEVQRDWVESSSSGMTIASTGGADYDLALTGGHNTVTNTIPVRSGTLPAGYVKEYTGSFELHPLELDAPADLFSESINFGFVVDDMGQVSYGYDFSRELGIGDINCKSTMKLVHQPG
ncbi:hypothetical protein P0O24_12020 [Methanotrichaceae archaeon M04Ac]|uniref:Lipoprotein n=1 Tax=Candidatus Methanocrinis alkalitolerans TaxID=3033395 RepID=A0ABT5XI47_9EURY|nr:hypothetical protein [Candidatus Methanocrinis alkalitolerans]MDF0594306.1 hypothetical protein [Candidatus Methanocrinis alkalitolerans]